MIPPKVRITTLVNDTAMQGFEAEHGLSFLIERNGAAVLFDTGQGQALAGNAAAAGADLTKVQAIVLSHGHYDHTGGLPQALAQAPGATVYAHPAATEPKFSGSGGETHPVGMPPESQPAQQRPGARWVWTREPREIAAGLHVTGPIPRRTAYEDTGGLFYLDSRGLTPDPLPDDQAVFFTGAAGVVAVLGCAHAGVVNTMEYIQELTGAPRLHAVLGGMHLLAACDNRITATLDALSGVELLAPNHCTGDKAVAAMEEAFAGRVRPLPAGACLEF